METFRMSDIVSNGDFSPKSRDVLSVLWAITQGCNYRCSYCPPGNKTKFSNFSSKENLLRAAQILISLNRPGYQITLYGGEPTYHPHFLDILEYLIVSEAPILLRMYTNGSRSPQFFEKMIEITRDTPFRIIFSLQLEYAKFENFKRVIEMTAGAGMSIAVSLTFLPTLREKARKYTDELLALRMKIPFFMNISFPWDIANGVMGEGCIDEDFAWCKASRDAFARIPMPSHLKSPFFTRVLSDITIEHEGKRKSLDPAESLQIESKYDGISSQQNPSYQDFYCCGGTNVIHLQEDGTVLGGVCSSAQRLGNIFFDSATTIIEHMNVVHCNSTICGSVENIPLPKFRNFDEAEACVSDFKERAKSYFIKYQEAYLDTLSRADLLEIAQQLLAAEYPQQRLIRRQAGEYLQILQHLKDERAWWQVEMERLNTELACRVREMANLEVDRKQLEALVIEFQAAQGRIAVLENECASLRSTVADLRESTSWKVTKPLRWFGRVVRFRDIRANLSRVSHT